MQKLLVYYFFHQQCIIDIREWSQKISFRQSMSQKLSLLLLFLYPFFAVAQNVDSDLRNEKPDVDAKFPGGMDSMKKFLNANFEYPIEARMKGIEGTVHIKFVVSKSGDVEPESVKVIHSLYAVCDQEAIRLVKMLPRWEPASKNNQPIKSIVVLPIDFTLTTEEKAAYAERDSITTQPSSFYKFQQTITALVGEKPLKQTSTRWKVYRDFHMTDTVGSVRIGEEVEVVDWDYHVYRIKTNKLSGYISWLALQKNTALAPANKLVATTINSNRPVRKMIVEGIKPLANLSLTVDKRSVYVGECFMARLSFDVNTKNRVPLQFTELDKQVGSFFPPESSVKICWTTRSFIEDIVGIEKTIDSSRYLSYAIWQKPYCPSEVKDVLIPPLSVKILTRNNKQSDTLIFYTKPIKIKVKPLPPNVITNSYDFFSMVGNYSMQDTILSREVKAGVPIIYKVTITGNGSNTFPISAPELSTQSLEARLIDIQYYDTIDNDRYTSRRTFTYSLALQKTGSFDLSDKVTFSFFNPKKNKVTTLKSDKKVNVLPGVATLALKPESLYNMFSKLILVDVSKSMLFNDYHPTRLQSALDGTSEFLRNRKSCDIGIITFSGQARLHNIKTENMCYSDEVLQSIGYDSSRRSGTAIWDAIWFSKQAVNRTSPVVLVLIGDGENNSGSSTSELAVALARKYNIKIYTIGLGTNGPVTVQGITSYVYENFSDHKDLKRIALQTGGKYFWAKDAQSITLFLRQIFP
jgi:TonB family protein